MTFACEFEGKETSTAAHLKNPQLAARDKAVSQAIQLPIGQVCEVGLPPWAALHGGPGLQATKVWCKVSRKFPHARWDCLAANMLELPFLIIPRLRHHCRASRVEKVSSGVEGLTGSISSV